MTDRLATHERHMRQAIALGRLGVGFVSPNPPVGAVVVAGGEVVGRGYHARFGGSHAEVAALGAAGERCRGATLYVTLEPCRHDGQTPPCTKAILEAGIARLIYGAADPHPVAGGGGGELAAAGVEVEGGVCDAECHRLTGAFLKHTLTGMPLVVAKWAMSLDGRIATRTGDSRWVSSAEARSRGHTLRAEVDAVLVGVGTVLADDPQLSCRLAGHPDAERFVAAGVPPAARAPHQPACVVLDGHARTPPQARLVARASEAAVYIAVGPNAPVAEIAILEAHGVRVMQLPPHPERPYGVDPVALLESLGSAGVQSVLIEGGSRVLGSFLDAGLVDRVVAFVSPKLIGGEQARPAVAGQGIERISEAPALREIAVLRAGEDVVIEGILGACDWGSERARKVPHETQ